MYEQEFFSVSQAAHYLNVPDDEIRRAAEDGRLPVCFRFRGKLGAFPALPKTLHQELGKVLFPEPLATCFFEGYLRSRTSARLFNEIETIKVRTLPDKRTAVLCRTHTIDVVTINACDVAKTIRADLDLVQLLHSSGYLGVVGRTGIQDRITKK